MSTTPIETGVDNRMAASLETRSIQINDSGSVLESGVRSSNHPATISLNDNNERTWINTCAHVDQVLSGSLLHLCYRIFDIIILLIGLSSSTDLCNRSNRLAVTSICLLIFYFIDLTIIVYFFLHNISPNYRILSDEEKAERLRRVAALRGFFIFFKLIPVCVGTSYALASKAPDTNDCELLRFCLGIVCISTLLIVVIPPTKPELPARRSFPVECFVLLCMLTINGTYFGTVAASMKNVTHSSCIYSNTEDLYLDAPLKTYAYAGLILFGCTTLLNVINVLVSHVCYRLTNGRQLYTYYYGIQYILNYFSALVLIYYFSVGALFLFQPRSGGLCRTEAPGLYKTLLIWQWIRILFPLLAVPLIIILCCLGVVFGVILSYFLPASITVPLLEILRV